MGMKQADTTNEKHFWRKTSIQKWVLGTVADPRARLDIATLAGCQKVVEMVTVVIRIG